MTAKNQLPPIHPALADVALIDGPTCAAAAGISISKFLEDVRAGEAPQPAMRAPRCTRWRLADVRTWLIVRASRPGDGSAVIARAKKASDVAKARRAEQQPAGA